MTDLIGRGDLDAVGRSLREDFVDPGLRSAPEHPDDQPAGRTFLAGTVDDRSAEPVDSGEPLDLVEAVNMVRLALTPGAPAARIVNLSDVRAFFRSRLARQLARTGDPVIAALYEEFFTDPPSEDSATSVDTDVIIPMIIRHGGHQLSLFSTITVFGTPQDITVEEISVESYYPAEDSSAVILSDLAAQSG